jgi:NADPH:quinone reductase-like Zn-dependent oxidoreductase
MSAANDPINSHKMKAIVQDTYGSADVLQLKEIERPKVGDTEVLLRVRAAGVDRGVWHGMAGLPYLGRLAFGLSKPKIPTPGLDVSGIVEEVGAKVTAFKSGDEVFGVCRSLRGAFAEYACAKEEQLSLKPINLTFAQAAAVPVSATTALLAIRDAGKLKAGQKVLIIGAAGGVGSFAVQLAKSLGAEVTGVCSTTKLDLVRALGADHVIDYKTEDFADGQRRFALIVDIAGNRPVSHLRRALAPRGTLVIVGGEGGGSFSGGMGRTLWAVLLSAFVSQKLCGVLALVNKAHLQSLKEFIEAGKITPSIDRIFPLSQTAEAITYMVEGQVRGKVVISI